MQNETQAFSFMQLKMASGKRPSFDSGLNVVITTVSNTDRYD